MSDPASLTPEEINELIVMVNSGYLVGYESLNLVDRYCFPNLDSIKAAIPQDFPIDLDNLIGNFGLDDVQGWVEDIKAAKMVYVYAALTCIVVAVVYCILLKFFAKPIIWVSIIATGAGLIALALFTQNYLDNKIQDDSKWKDTLQVIVYTLYGLGGLYFLCVLCMYKGIQVSIAVLETAAVVIIRNIRTLIVPFISAVFIFGFIGIWILGAIYMVSSANITQPPRSETDTMSQLKDINFDGKE